MRQWHNAIRQPIVRVIVYGQSLYDNTINANECGMYIRR
jgi:hypothetical protein